MLKKNSTKTFIIDFTSPSNGEQYSGTFTCKKLSILDQTKISRRKSELCGGMYCVRDEDDKPTGQGIDNATEWINHMIAMLEVAIISSPPWWDLEEIYDEGLMVAVFEEVMAFEDSFRRPRGAEGGSTGRSRGGQEDSQEKHTKSVDDHNAPKVVDEKVQAALDV